MNALTDMVNSPDQVDVVIAGEVADEMFARLAWMTIQPATVLSVGCSEMLCVRLQQHFPSAQIITEEVVDAKVDVIFANMVLLSHDEHKNVFQIWRRLLRPNGLLIFSTLGLDTLKEVRAASIAMLNFVDMHDIGDTLLAAGFSDPVLDVDYVTTVYRDKQKLITELCASGMLQQETNDVQLEQTEEQTYELTYEVIFAHAFTPHIERSVTTDGVVKVPLSQLRRSL